MKKAEDFYNLKKKPKVILSPNDVANIYNKYNKIIAEYGIEMERDIPVDSTTSYQRDIDKFAWRNTFQGYHQLQELQKQQQLPQQIDSSYFVTKTPKGYLNVYDKQNNLVGYSIDNKTIVKQEPNFENGGTLYADEGLNPYFNKFKKTYELGQEPQELTSPTTNNFNWNQTNQSVSNPYSDYKQFQVDPNQANTQINTNVAKSTIYPSPPPEQTDAMAKLNMATNIIGGAGDAVIQGGSAIASMVGDESAGRALQKAGGIGKVAESFGNIVPIPGVGKALGAVASIFAAPFTAWGEHIATQEKNKGEADADFKMRNSGAITSNNPYGQYMAKYGANPKMMEQRVIDDIYSDFDKYMKLT